MVSNKHLYRLALLITAYSTDANAAAGDDGVERQRKN